MAWCRHLRQLLLGGHRLEDLDLRNYALPARLLLPPLGLLVLFATEAQALSPRSPPIRRGEIPSPARLAGTSLENSGKVSPSKAASLLLRLQAYEPLHLAELPSATASFCKSYNCLALSLILFVSGLSNSQGLQDCFSSCPLCTSSARAFVAAGIAVSLPCLAAHLLRLAARLLCSAALTADLGTKPVDFYAEPVIVRYMYD